MSNTVPGAEAIQSWCVEYVSKLLDVAPDKIDPTRDLDRLGLDSSTAVALLLSLEEQIGIELMPELLFSYPSIAMLSTHLAEQLSDAEGRA